MELLDKTIIIDRDKLTEPSLALCYFSLMRYGNKFHIPFNQGIQMQYDAERMCELTEGLVDRFVLVAKRELPDVDWDDPDNVEKLLHCFAYFPYPHPRLEEMCESLRFVRRHYDTLKLQGSLNGKSKKEIGKGALEAIEKGLENAIIDYLYKEKIIDDVQSLFEWPEDHEFNSIHILEYTTDLGKSFEFVLDRPTKIPDRALEYFSPSRKSPNSKRTECQIALQAYNRMVKLDLCKKFDSRNSVSTNIACLICDILECLDYKFDSRTERYKTRESKRDFIKDLIF